MRNKKNWVLDIAFLLIVIVATFYGVFHGQDLTEIKSCLYRADTSWWYIGAAVVVGYILCEASIFYFAMRPLQSCLKFLHCLLFSCIGFFFTLITPMGIGGQPALVVAMRKDDISMTVSIPVLIVITITFKSVLILFGLVVLLARPAAIYALLQPAIVWCWIGLALNILFVGFLFLMIFKPLLIERPALALVRWYAGKKAPERAEDWCLRVQDAIERYGSVADYFKTHRNKIYGVFALTFVQRCALFYVSYLAYRSFGLSGTGAPEIVTLQAMISVAVEMLPIPGGMGITESLFLKIFGPICAKGLSLPVLIVSRGISYYVQLLLCGLLTVVSVFVLGKDRAKRLREEERIH